MAGRRAGDPGRIAFRISPELRARTEAALAAVREAPADRPRVEELVEVILELTEAGLDYYYLEPLRRADVGAMSTAAARLGVAAAGRSLPTIVRRVVLPLDEAQILSIAEFIDELLIPAG